MPRWNGCFVDPRAIENKGQWGLYKCERCGKLHWYRMCARKKAKHIFCSTKCKKDNQVKYDRPRIDDKLFKRYYDDNYQLVRTIAFQFCENKTACIQYLEDCMQYGFLELWNTYNRNGMDCSKKYLRKAIKHNITDNMQWWFKQNRLYVANEELTLERR